jgi:hypothetical protein
MEEEMGVEIQKGRPPGRCANVAKSTIRTRRSSGNPILPMIARSTMRMTTLSPRRGRVGIHHVSVCMPWKRMTESIRLVTDPLKRKRSRRRESLRSLPSAADALAAVALAALVAAPLDLHPLRLNEALGMTPIQWIGSM